MKRLFTLLVAMGFIVHCMLAQNGRSDELWDLPKEGVIRALVIFAQFENDDNEGSEYYQTEIWPKDSMPVNLGFFIDTEIKENSEDYTSLVSQYYNEISFGKLHIICDYYPELVTVGPDDFDDSYYNDFDDVINKAIGKQSFVTAHNYKYPEDFDNWRKVNNRWIEGKDSSPELRILIVRYNGKTKDYGERLGNRVYITAEYAYNSLLRHEIAHFYLPSNNFHSGGHNAGDRYFMTEPNAFSILSGNDGFMKSYNAWDRHRMGWFPDDYQYEIQAKDVNGVIRNTDLVYGEPFPGGVNEFIIRDTPSTGDAVRIKLPYVSYNGVVDNQYIWLENHQFVENTVNARYWGYGSKFVPKGLYINYQVGNDNLSSNSNVKSMSITTLPSFGNYDYTLSDTVSPDGKTVYVQKTADEYNNPFTGKSIMDRFLEDANNDDKLAVSPDLFNPYYTYKNGRLIPESDCGYLNYLFFASKWQCFYEGEKAGIGYNPSLVPKMTYTSPDIRYSTTVNTKPEKSDNRKIYLNGLSVEFLEQRANGDIKVRVRYDDYDVCNSLRWCGDIELNEKIVIKSGKTITLDRGLTATRPTSPEMFNGIKTFTSPTVFTAKSGSEITIESGAAIDIKNGSALILESGSKLVLKDGAKLIVRESAGIKLDNLSCVVLEGDSRIVIESGAEVYAGNNINLTLQDKNSLILCYEGYVNSYTNFIESQFTGSGDIVFVKNNVYIQNESITSENTTYAKKAHVGSDVTDDKANGNVVIKAGGNLSIRYDNEVTIEKGFNMENGAKLDIKKN